MAKVKKIISASLLIAGTTIGAGMLALPIATAACGFYASIILFFICYLFMLSTGILLAEALSWYKKELNLVSLSSIILGRWGKYAAWALYLFLFYTLCVAYTAGGGDILSSLFGLSKGVAQTLFVVFFAFFVMKGTGLVNFINHYLMIGMLLAYAALIFLGFSKINFSYLTQYDFSKLFWGLPVVFTSFSFQGTIPSLYSYLNKDVKLLKKSIALGLTLPFLLYVIWQGFIMGIIPLNVLSGLEGSAIFQLEKLINNPVIFSLSKAFAFFAITTSFLGVTLGLKDFLKDGLQVSNKAQELLILIMTFLPPLLIAQVSLNAFMTALRFAGGIGCALLLGLMPILMVYKGRYVLNHDLGPSTIINRKLTLATLAFFVICEVLYELYQIIG